MSEVAEILYKTTGWNNFQSAIKDASTQIKGDAFEQLVKKYLLFDPIYRTKIKKVWLLEEVPQTISVALNLPSTDQGIDIIAETHNGEYWAIQCKYKSDPTQSLTWREVSTFTGLTFGVCKGISFGLICTTGERYTKILQDQENIGFCTNEVWSSLAPDFFKTLNDDFYTPKIAPYTPRPHQERAINNAKDYFKTTSNQRGKFIMPCGTGKSLTAFWIAKELDAKTVLVSVPSISLLRQTLGVWLREYYAEGARSDLEWLCVCSDESVSTVKDDDAITFTQDLGIPCTTNSKQIVNWLNDTREVGTRIIFSTYQSGKVISLASRQTDTTYDVGILDEAHKTVGRKDSLFSHLLFDENISIKKRIFMTATERRYLGKGDEIASMENPDLYGDTFELLTFKDALIQRPKIISDYKILTLFIAKSEVADIIKRNQFVKPSHGKWNDEIEAEMLASLIALKKAMRQFPINHAVSFHSSISRARAFKENAELYTSLFPEYGDLDTFHISGKNPASVRHRVLTEFGSSAKSLITNAKCLTEGIDLPEIDCVLFADPKKSKVDIVQALGRALRPARGKENGYIVIPIIVDEEVGLEAIWESNSFTDLLTTLRALASNDERIIDYFRSVSVGKNNRTSLFPEPIESPKLARTIDLEEFSKSIEIHCWDRLSKLSYKSFNPARKIVHSLGLHSEFEWRLYCQNRLKDLENNVEIPDDPENVYKSDWISWKDWLGNKSLGARYLKYEYAKRYVHTLNLVDEDDWKSYSSGNLPEYQERPAVIPPSPQIIYFNEWKGWKDWLGSPDFLPYQEAKAFVHNLKLNSRTQWEHYINGELGDSKKPLKIPARPHLVYKDQWQGWDDWLGISYRKKTSKYRKFSSARSHARSLNMQNRNQWNAYCGGEWIIDGKKRHKPSDIPNNPATVYSLQWKGWDDWLAIEKPIFKHSNYSPFEEARAIVHSFRLYQARTSSSQTTINTDSSAVWKLYINGKLLGFSYKPANIPENPQQVYGREWTNWDNWIGKYSDAWIGENV